MPGGLGPDDLHQIALDLLTACAASLDEIPTLLPGEGLVGAPTRQIIYPGEPVWDCCEQLVVHSPGIGDEFTRPASPAPVSGFKHKHGAWIPLVNLTVTIGRCVPQGEVKMKAKQYIPPTAIALTDAARQINADGWALYNGIKNRLYQGILSELCSSWKWQGVNSATPAGGCAGWTINFQAQLDGYGATDTIST